MAMSGISDAGYNAFDDNEDQQQQTPPGPDPNRLKAVQGYYSQYLGRTPDQSDSGLMGWVNGGMDLGAIENGIKGSDEAQQWLGSQKAGSTAAAGQGMAGAPSTPTSAPGTGTYSAQAPTDPSKFVGYDFGAHQGQTFDYSNPAEGAKYAVSNVLNGMDPNDPNWAATAAATLNKQFGGNLFNAAGSRLSYGDEFVDSDPSRGWGGTFHWGSNGPGPGGAAGGPGGAGGPKTGISQGPSSGGFMASGPGLTDAGTQDATKAQSDALYQQLLDRSKQSLTVDPNDPTIHAQTAAHAATTDRETRNYLADLAEKSGSLANLSGEQRIAAEHAGQDNAGFQSELMGRELQSRRDEISQSLESMRGMLTSEQQNNLQMQLAQLDAQIKRESLAQQNSQFGSNLGYQYAQLGQQGSQFDRQLAQQGSQFGQNLGYQYSHDDNAILQMLLSRLGQQ